MPYMTCNGRTVSRHSTTPEVKQCKAAEQQAKITQHTTCMADIECSAKFQADQMLFGWIIGIVCFLLVVGLLSIVVPNFEDD